MATAAPVWLTLDRAAGDLEGQLYRAMRDRILAGQLAAGQSLAPTRGLAAALGIARATVVAAYDRLKAEGYLDSRMGTASRVAALAPPPAAGRGPLPPPAARPAEEVPAGRLFEPGEPDLSAFPHAAWARCLGARARALRVHDLGYGAAGGIRALQDAILGHVAATRGVAARPEQVLVLPTTGAAIDLLARLRLRPGQDAAWVEEPGYPTARALLQAAGARILPVPCDAQGMDVARAAGPPPRLICVTPSHHYPTGATMSLQRRLALLEIAHAGGALVLEDDYDNDFQYASRPIAALQGIDRGAVVAYLGSFSKILAPGLRVAYAILPAWLAEEAAAAARLRGAVVPVHIQAALADFIREGRLRAHLRRMNALYAARMAATVAALRRHCGRVLEVGEGAGGLQLATWFRDPATDDRAAVARLGTQGIALRPMSRFYGGTPRPGLLFGIARVDPDWVDAAAARVGALLGDGG
ncbi:MAG TPA: PLP-dependent aminotransferase family protein [Roseomonas sp.]|jgi:GntR family transcriptional regulator/MocR family aminotransferase